MTKPVLTLVLAALMLAGRAARAADAESTAAFDPTADYEVRHLQGWDVLVSKRLLQKAQRRLCTDTLRLLDDHLFRITRAVPARALADLRRIAVWVELAEGHHPCMCYHPSAGWLRQHGMNPQKAGCVEIANAKNFLKWTQQQPWMVLHELAHGYHDQVLGFDHAGIRDCYHQAVEAKRYDSVLHWDGHMVRAYALQNEKEFFAEMTEAYFGSNDFYPFVRAELKECDPKTYELIEEVWGVRPAAKQEAREAK